MSFFEEHRLIVQSLVRMIAEGQTSHLDVLNWASPVPFFGDIESAEIATLGINPSNREFVSRLGFELDESERRMHTLSSMQLKNWGEASTPHISKIIESCQAYFQLNPYTGWFSQLDAILRTADASYFDDTATRACHLDLTPYATEKKWSQLGSNAQNALMKVGHEALAKLLRSSKIKTLVANGMSVVTHLMSVSNCEIKVTEMPEWALTRNGVRCLRGFSFIGNFDRLCAVPLGRSIRLLGYNHNIQSSFGVTNQVRQAISNWIKEAHSNNSHAA